MDDSIELKRLPNGSRSRRANSTPSDDEDEDELFDPATAALGGRKRSSSSVSSSLSAKSFELYTPEEEKAVIRKLDMKLVTFMSFLYLLSFLDRSNIGNAKIQGLPEDLNLHDDQFDWLLTAFYITYISFEWMILLYHYLRPHVYVSICVMSWGIIASLQSLSRSFWTLFVLRALLGVGEAAFSPGVPFYLSFFYKREELALRAGMQVSAAPLAASFAGSLAYAIGKLGERSPLAPWRLLFLVEGFPSVIVAIIAYSFVPDSPDKAKFLTPRQRKIAKLRLRKELSPSEAQKTFEDEKHGTARGRKRVDWKDIGDTIKDPKCYMLALMFSSCNIAFASMPVFLPSVINELGYSSISSQALSAPPFLVSFIVMLVTARLSDKMAARSPFVCVHALLGFFGYAMIALGGIFDWPHFLRYLCVYPAAAGFFSAITIIITWTINNQESNAKKGTGMTILNLIGQCGPLLGTRLFPDSDKPNYVHGMAACAAAMLFVFCLAVALRIVLVYENRRRAREFQKLEEARAALSAEGEEAKAVRHAQFVLML